MQTIKETKEQVHTHSHVNVHDKGESAAALWLVFLFVQLLSP